MNKILLTGYHGTNFENKESILTHNFNLSRGDKEWLGDGVYFFIEGLSNPIENAKKWAEAEASRKKYTQLVVFEAIIEVEESKFLDLTTTEGMKIYGKIREGYIEKITKAGKKPKRGFSPKDGYILNQFRKKARKYLPIDVIKGNFWIKFAPERIYNIDFRIPNTTIVSVVCPKLIIKRTVILEQDVKNGGKR